MIDYVRSPMHARPLGGEPVDNPDVWQQTTHGLYLPPPEPAPCLRHGKPIAVDLFSGAGGFACGMKQAGLHVAAACEFDVDASLTYMTNLGAYPIQIHYLDDGGEEKLEKALIRNWKENATDAVPTPSVSGSGWISSRPQDSNGRPIAGCEHFFFGDVRNLIGTMILNALGIKRGEITVVFGGPPCQGYSRAGRQNVMDPRNSLVFEFTRLVAELAPDMFVFENVPGMVDMVTPEGIPVIEAIAMDLDRRGYGTRRTIQQALQVTSGSGGAGRGTHLRDLKQHRTSSPRDCSSDEHEQDSLFDQRAA